MVCSLKDTNMRVSGIQLSEAAPLGKTTWLCSHPTCPSCLFHHLGAGTNSQFNNDACSFRRNTFGYAWSSQNFAVTSLDDRSRGYLKLGNSAYVHTQLKQVEGLGTESVGTFAPNINGSEEKEDQREQHHQFLPYHSSWDDHQRPRLSPFWPLPLPPSISERGRRQRPLSAPLPSCNAMAAAAGVMGPGVVTPEPDAAEPGMFTPELDAPLPPLPAGGGTGWTLLNSIANR